jgi:AcrR family transcriptional regulator
LNYVQDDYPGQMPREKLTTDHIVTAALEVLDEEGLEGLNMRRLGDRLGSAATAVYWHVGSKERLVELAADSVWREIELPDPDAIGWRNAATIMASGFRAMIARHLWMVPAMGSYLIYGPGKARHDEHALAVYEAAGFTGAKADQALNAVYMFVAGQALSDAAEAAWKRRLTRDGASLEEQSHAVMAQIAAITQDFPRLHARAAGYELVDPAAADEGFEFGLSVILDGLEARLAG